MLTMWSKLIMTLSLALSAAVYPQYIGLEIDGALTLNYKTGDYMSVRNTGTQMANFYIKTDVDWVFVYREGYNNSTSVHISEGLAVNFILEIHPELVSDGSHEAKVTITADHLLEPITFSTREVKLTFNKNVEIETVSSVSASPSVAPIASVEPSVTPTPLETTVTDGNLPLTGQATMPTATPKIIKQTPITTAKPIISSPISSLSSSPSPSPSITKTPLKSVEIEAGDQDGKSFWQILKNIFSWFY